MSDPFARTVEAFLQGETREYKSAKGRYSTRDGYFYSYAMQIAWQRRDHVVEVLHDGRAPTRTTAGHLQSFRTAVANSEATLETVYTLGARVCRRCGGRHGKGIYHDVFCADRKTFASAEDVCAIRQAVTAAQADADQVARTAEERGLVAASAINYAAARDLGLPFELGYTWVNSQAVQLDNIGSKSLFVEPLVAEVFAVSGVNQRVKRATLKRMRTDPEFHKAVEALIVAPGLLRSFLVNYAKEQLS